MRLIAIGVNDVMCRELKDRGHQVLAIKEIDTEFPVNSKKFGPDWVVYHTDNKVDDAEVVSDICADMDVPVIYIFGPECTDTIDDLDCSGYFEETNRGWMIKEYDKIHMLLNQEPLTMHTVV